MHRTYLLPALFLAAGAIVCLFLAGGGCGDGGRRRSSPCASSGPRPPRVEIGPDARRVGRLEEPAVVRATVFEAGEGRGREAETELAPGTWLVPGSVFREPGTEVREER